MSILGSTFGFLYPAILSVAIPAIGLLVWAYLRRGKGKRVRVGSVLFLKLLEQKKTARKKFVPPPRFFFELLVLLLLVLGSAGLFKQDTEQKIAVVVDNSFGTNATVTVGRGKEKLLDILIRDAQKFLSGRLGSESVKVFTTTPTLTAVKSNFVSLREANKLLGTIKPKYGADNLESALRQVASDEKLKRIIVVTDKQAKLSEGGDRRYDERFDIISQAPIIKKESPTNISISNITASPQDQSTVVKLALTAFGGKEIAGTINLYTARRKLEARQPFKLNGNSTEETLFVLKGNTSRALSAELEIDNPNLDALAEDNSAFIVTNASSTKVAVVSDYNLSELGLDGLSHIAFEKRDINRVDDVSTVIYHRLVPPKLPKANILFIVPPLEIPTDVKTTDYLPSNWNGSHPILSYVKFENLKLGTLFPIDVPEWGEEILSTTGGPAIVAGNGPTGQTVITGFELFPYTGKTSPVLSVLTLNIIKWLANAELSGGYVNVYSNLENSEGQTVQPEAPGFVEIGSDNKAAVNFFDEQESNVSTIRKVSYPEKTEFVDAEESQETYAPLIAAIVLSLLILDLLISAIVRLRKRRLA